MRNNFWSLLWQSFENINGNFLTLALTFFSLLTWYITKEIQIYSIWFIVIVLFSLILILTLSKAINILQIEIRTVELNLQTEKDNNKSLLKDNENLVKELEEIKSPPITFAKREENDKILCLLKKSSLFHIGQFIAVFYQDENTFESLIAIGLIKNVQSDGQIQILIESPDELESSRNIFDRLGNNENAVKEKIIIKSNIDRILLTYF